MLKKLLVNSFSSAMVPIVKMGITFIMAPVIVHALGNYDYGIWEMVFAVVGYMGMLDMGLSPAIIRYVSRENALQNKDELRRIYSSAMAFFFPVGLVMSFLLIFAAIYPQYFFSDLLSSNKYSMFLIIIAFQVVISFSGMVFDTFLEGLQRYTLRNNATIVTSIGGALVLYPLLKTGGGLITLAAANAIGFTLKNIFYGISLARQENGGFYFQRKDVCWRTLKELLLFGFKSFIYAASFSIGHLTDKLILGAFINPIAVTFYTVPVNLLGQARDLIWAIVRVFLPVFSELDASDEKEQLQIVLFTASRYALAAIFPMLVGICMLGPVFLQYWIGESYAQQGRWVLYIMSVAFFFQFLCPFKNRFLMGVGKLKLQAQMGVISLIVHIIISVALVRYIGKEGVALGTLLPAVLVEPYLLWFTCRVAGGNLWQYAYSVFLPLLIPTALFAFFLFLLSSYFPPQNLGHVIGFAILGISIYLPLFVYISMTSEERQKLLGEFNKRFLKGRMKH